jgi:hypothetical protein
LVLSWHRASPEHGETRKIKRSPTSGIGKGRSLRLLKFECGRPHRHSIVVRRDPQQFELCARALYLRLSGTLSLRAMAFTALCLFTYRLTQLSGGLFRGSKEMGCRGRQPYFKATGLRGDGGDGASGAMPTSKYSIRSFSSKQDKRRSRFSTD